MIVSILVALRWKSEMVVVCGNVSPAMDMILRQCMLSALATVIVAVVDIVARREQ